VGRVVDPETGLQYLRARHYDPTTGQFLTRDPIEAITRSPYAYVQNNPINGTDPTGLCGPFGSGGCPGGSLVPDEISDPIGTAGNKIKGAGQTVGRCLGDPITCGENIEKAMLPIVVGGMTVVVGAGLVAACATLIGCVVAAPLLGGGVVAGAYATWLSMDALWFGEGHDQAYHPLGGHHEEHEEPDDCDPGSGSW
jgi:RHS repeat-associated protein